MALFCHLRQRHHRLRGVLGHDGEAAKGGPGWQEWGGVGRVLPRVRQVRLTLSAGVHAPGFDFFFLREMFVCFFVLRHCSTHSRLWRRNADGYIDRDEFALIIRSTGEAVTEEEIDELIKDGDKNADGMLDFDGTWSVMISVWGECRAATLDHPNKGQRESSWGYLKLAVYVGVVWINLQFKHICATSYNHTTTFEKGGRLFFCSRSDNKLLLAMISTPTLSLSLFPEFLKMMENVQ